MPHPNAVNGLAYLHQINIMKGLALYTFTAWAPSADILNQHTAEIAGIVKSFQFTI
jgi:hypothetical protein